MSKILNIYTAIFFCLLGLAFSGWNAFFKESVFCLTAGCHVLADFTIFNISLWLYSFVFFIIVNVLLMIKKESLAFALLFLGLVGDMGLLGLMLFTAPCFNCLIIALILALSFFTMAYGRSFRKISFAFLGIWALLFVINAGAIGKAMLSPYTIYINPEYKEEVYASSMRIFFSPSCPACKTVVAKLGSEEVTIEADIAWIPVAEKSDDIVLVMQLEKAIQEGMSLKEAMEEVIANPKQSSFETLVSEFIMQVKLLINQSILSQRGTSRIPFVEYTGLPAHISEMNTDIFIDDEKSKESHEESIDMLEQLRRMSPDAQYRGSKDSPSESLSEILSETKIGVGAFCDQTTEEPCD